MTNEEAIELAKRAIAPCRGVTLKALQMVIEMAERYNAQNISDNTATKG